MILYRMILTTKQVLELDINLFGDYSEVSWYDNDGGSVSGVKVHEMPMRSTQYRY